MGWILLILILNIKLFIIPEKSSECVCIFFVHAGCPCSRAHSVTPKLCPRSSVRHLALETFHLPGHAMCHAPPCAETFIHFVYFNHELWTDCCGQKWLECHKTDTGHFYLVLGRKFLFSLALAFHFCSLVKTHKSPVLSKHHAKYYSDINVFSCLF